MIKTVRTAALNLDSFKALKGKQREEAISGLKSYARDIEGDGFTPERVEHNVKVKLEALRLRDRINATPGLTKQQRTRIYQALGRRLGATMLKKDDERDLHEASTEFGFELKDVQVDFNDLIKEALKEQK